MLLKRKYQPKRLKKEEKIEMMDIFRDPAEVAKEQAEIARLKKKA
jgi:predicted CoA-binding protein